VAPEHGSASKRRVISSANAGLLAASEKKLAQALASAGLTLLPLTARVMAALAAPVAAP